MVRDVDGDKMRMFTLTRFWQAVKLGTVSIVWLVAVLIFCSPCGRLSAFVSMLFDGLSVSSAMGASFSRDAPIDLMFLGFSVASPFFLVQFLILRSSIWKLILLSLGVLPFLMMILVLLNFLAWADKQGLLLFGLEYQPWFISVFVVSIFIGVGVFFGRLAARVLRIESGFSSGVLYSAFIYVNAGAMIAVVSLLLGLIY